MWKQFAFAALLAVALVGCKDTAPAANSFRGLGDVRVIDSHLISSGDAATGVSSGALTYIVIRAELTNSGSADFTPDIGRFVLTDSTSRRYQAIDHGSSVLTFISNSSQPLKKGDKREYTFAFRATDALATGVVTYEP